MHTFRLVGALVAGVGSGLFALSAVGATVRGADAQPVSRPTTVVTSGLSTQSPIIPSAAAPVSRAHEWSFQLDETTLSNDVNAWAAAQPPVQTPLGVARLQDVTMSLRADQLGLRGTAVAGWVHAAVNASATASVEHGRVLVQIVGVNLNGAALPDSVRRQLEQQVQDQLDRSIESERVLVSSVLVGEGSLTVSGTLK